VLALRSKGVPVATIPESAVAYSMGMADMVIVGAEGVVENGGIISRMGTYQIGLLAKAMGKPFYVVAESHKFVRLYPLGQYDLPIDQHVVEFKTDDGRSAKVTHSDQKTTTSGVGDPSMHSDQKSDYLNSLLSGETQATRESGKSLKHYAVDFTPPHLVSALITESGVLTPSAVSEELIKIWF